MKLGRDGVTKLADDEEDTTVAPEIVETEEAKAERLAAEAEGARLAAGDGEETDEEKVARVEAERVAAEAAAESEVVVTIGEDPPPSDEDDSKAPEWVRELRKSHRAQAARIRELETAQQKGPQGEQQLPAVGDKPKLEDFDYDTAKFGTALEGWHERKRVADDAAAKKQEAEKAAKEAWQATLDTYGKAKAGLKVKDADDAEAVAQEYLSTTQQGIILAGAENPALLVYALGKNPKKAKELGSIKDPVKFAFAVAKLETQVKATPRKAPPPERKIEGSAPKGGVVDSHLEKLRTEAERTGDFSKVTAYRREKRTKAATAK